MDTQEPPDLVSGSELMDPAVEPEVHGEPTVDRAAAATARRQLATFIRGPEDDASRQHARIRSQTRGL